LQLGAARHSEIIPTASAVVLRDHIIMHKGEMRGSEGCYYLYDGRKKISEGKACWGRGGGIGFMIKSGFQIILVFFFL